jgi:hypothetical protein
MRHRLCDQERKPGCGRRTIAERRRKNSATGNCTRVFCVTGRNTNHYTITDLTSIAKQQCTKLDLKTSRSCNILYQDSTQRTLPKQHSCMTEQSPKKHPTITHDFVNISHTHSLSLSLSLTLSSPSPSLLPRPFLPPSSHIGILRAINRYAERWTNSAAGAASMTLYDEGAVAEGPGQDQRPGTSSSGGAFSAIDAAAVDPNWTPSVGERCMAKVCILPSPQC